MLTKNEMETICHAALEKYEFDYSYIGLRFEDKERKIGDICENSRHNLDREDERDFPDYNTDEYEEMFELDGTSAWNLEAYTDFDDENAFNTFHCYIIAGDSISNEDDALDDNEIVIEDAKVIGIVF